MKKQEIEAFVRHLEVLRDGKGDEISTEAPVPRPDRAAMTTLRRALSGEERDILPAYQHLNRYLPLNPKEQNHCILIAALFADHQKGSEQGTLGSHLADLVRMDPGKQTVANRRFTQLLTAHIDDLPACLRHIVSLLKSVGIPINWSRLLRDVLHWEVDGERTRRQWAYDFWGPSAKEPLVLDTTASEVDSPVLEQLTSDETDSFEADY